LTYALAIAATPALHGLCFPPTAVHWLAWIAFVPWFVAIRLAGRWSAQALTCVITLMGGYFVASWLPRAVSHYYNQPVWLGLALYFGVWLLTVAPSVTVFTACYRLMARRFGAALPLLAGAAWAATEFGRVQLFVRDPFGLFGYSQVNVPAMVQIADITGVYGVSFVIVAVNAALAECYLAWAPWQRGPSALAGADGGRSHRRAAATGLTLALASTALVLAYGAYRLARPAADEAAPATRIAVVQANLDLGSQWRQEFYGRTLEEQMLLTLAAQRRAAPALVFWPENAMTFFIETEPAYQRSVASGLAAGGMQLVAGGPHAVINGGGDPRYFNSAFLIASNGSVSARYDKEQLLPFAEYFPFSSMGLLRRDFGRVREFTPGNPTAPLPTVAGPAGVVICNEAMFPDIVRARVAGGASYLVVLSNDSWLGDAQFAAEAFDMARMRAIEQRRYLVRASTSGPSAIVDPGGRVQVALAPFTADFITGTIASRNAISFYGRHGDIFTLGCALAVAVGLIMALRGATARG